MKTYYTRVSAVKVTVIVVVLLALAYIGPQDWRYYAAVGFILLITLAGLFTTRYWIEGTTLKVSKLLLTHEYDLTKLFSVKADFSLLSDLAASTDCIYLAFDDGKVADISPRHQEVFIEELRMINPRISIDMTRE